MEDAAGRWGLRKVLAGVQDVGRETLRIFASTPRVLALVWRASPGHVAALGALTVAQALLPGANVWVAKLIVDGVVAAVGAGGDEAALRALVGFVALQLALGV